MIQVNERERSAKSFSSKKCKMKKIGKSNKICNNMTENTKTKLLTVAE